MAFPPSLGFSHKIQYSLIFRHQNGIFYVDLLSRLALKIVVMTREQGTLNWEQVLDNFTFRYLCRFFPFTYLSQDLHKTKRHESERDFRVNEPPEA